MNRRIVKVVLMLTGVAVAPGMTVAEAEVQGYAMSGKAKLTYTKREVVPVGDTEGHVVMLGDASGLNTNSGVWEFMDGARARSIGIQDLTGGTGPQSGYFILSKDGNVTVSQVSGTVKTVLSPDGKPQTTMSGEWKYIRCIGVYAGCTGHGSYQGSVTAENEYLVEFKGILVQ